MRKILIIGWLSCFCFLGVKAQVDLSVQLTIRDGASGTAKTAIERSLSALLTEINNAYIENRALNLVSLHMTDDARAGLTSMWENVHFYCDDAEVVQNCLRKGLSGYQIRQIPLMMRPTGSATTQDDEFQEGVVNLSESGQITRFNVALATNSYLSVISRGTNVTDTRRREEILSYVEHFRTAYEEKDLAFMNQIFSDDALIITGTVVSVKPMEDRYANKLKVVYKKQNKEQYIANLKKAFLRNKWIDVKFSDIPENKNLGCAGITQSQVNRNMFGVRLLQEWRSSNYSDVGYLFLLWDFTDKNKPVIHVRTWQPEYVGDVRQEPDVNISTLGAFDL